MNFTRMGDWIKAGVDWKLALKTAADEGKGLIVEKNGNKRMYSSDDVQELALKHLQLPKQELSEPIKPAIKTLKLNYDAVLPSKNFNGNLNKVLQDEGFHSVMEWFENEKGKK